MTSPSIALFAGLLLMPHQVAACEDDASASPVRREAVQRTLTRSTEFLLRDGRAWFEGKTMAQPKRNGCVSCHQVPSGIWSAAAAYRAVEEEPPAEFDLLFQDAVEFVSQPGTGQPASWAQLILGGTLDPAAGGETPNSLVEKWWPEIRESQEESGAWLAAGQFPTQLRPIEESNAVVTMWMMRALNRQSSRDGAVTKEIQNSLQQGRTFVSSIEGSSTEWIAWRLLTAEPGSEEAAEYSERLRKVQNEDGSWGWKPGESGIPYTTGVALYALSATRSASGETLDRAARFLIQGQQEDGSWENRARFVSQKKNSKKMDYVYRYWGTAWATIGLAEYQKGCQDGS